MKNDSQQTKWNNSIQSRDCDDDDAVKVLIKDRLG